MPAPEHYRITYQGVIGTLAAPAEEWSMGVSAAPPATGFLTRGDLEGMIEALWDRFAPLAVGCTGQVSLSSVKIAQVDATGHTPRDVTGAYIQAEGAGTPGITGSGSGTNYEPAQLALVVSLLSEAAGPTGRGRFYLPIPILGAVGIDGRMDAGNRDGHATRAQAFINGLNDDLALLAFGPVVVASGGSASQGIDPGLRPVVNVAVGRVIDTQRRRRGDLQEDPAVLPVAF